VSEYNPFDIAPPIIDKPEDKPAEKPAPAPAQPSADVRYASPPPPRPSDPAAPGRAPLAGQPASMSAPMPQPQYAPPPPQMAQAVAPPPPMASEPVPPPGVRYDLAGNPLPPAIPYGAGGPGGAPPQDMQGGAVRYDLAGNPLPMQPMAPPPMPQAPAGQYGYAPAPPPPGGGGYGSGEYTPPQHSFRSPAAPQSIVPAGMEEAMTAGANWMIGIVVLTLATIWINATLSRGFMMPFISYAAITGVVLQPYMLAPLVGGSYVTGAVLASLGLIPLALLGVLGFRRQAWVFMIAMIVYGFDIPVTIICWIVHLDLWGIFLATAWHSFVFQRMFAAWTAAREINATLAGQRR